MAWKNAGYIGLDRFFLAALGTPWGPAKVGDEPKTSLRPASQAR